MISDEHTLSWAEYGKMQDRIEVLECREREYQKLIRLGITLITMKNELLEWYRPRLAAADYAADEFEQALIDREGD